MSLCDEPCDCHSYREGYIFPLMPILKRGIWHRTSRDGFQGICESGYIEPNNGQFRYSYSQTPFFYGARNGWICLFDFETTDENDYQCNWTNWAGFFHDQSPFTVCLQLNRERLPRLIPRSSAPDDEYGYIGWVECWYPEKISFDAVERILVTQMDSASASIIIRADLGAKDNFTVFP